MSKDLKDKTNKLIIMIVIIMLCNFVMPTCIYAAEFDGGIMFEHGAQILLMIPDLLAAKLQQIFIDEDSDIAILDPKGGVSNYYFRYSPGLIFSGKVPGLDVNFISPMGNEFGEVIFEFRNHRYNGPIAEDVSYDTLVNTYGLNLKETTEKIDYAEASDAVFWFGGDVVNLTWTINDENNDPSDDITYWYHVSTTHSLPAITYVAIIGITIAGICLAPYTGGSSVAIACKGLLAITGAAAADYLIQEVSELLTGGSLYTIELGDIEKSTRVSIAYSLRNTVASYYRVFQEIALVILLSMLVYVAIRMMLSSTAKDKAKYKEMLWHWVAAICLLFGLHFFMNIVLTSIQKINDIFASKVIDDTGVDILMTNVRSKIGFEPKKHDLSSSFVNILIYVTLVIYTIKYTIIYLKRVIHIAFLTMIAPMVAFTYPIDKMKDGKAQALSLWLKEFSFNALMQPIHMILYYVFVFGAMGFATKNPLYALVMIGFLKPAENFVRKIFGLEENSSLGNMASAIGGAALMSSIKKLAPQQKKSVQKEAGKGGEGQKPQVRTANPDKKDPYDTLREDK